MQKNLSSTINELLSHYSEIKSISSWDSISSISSIDEINEVLNKREKIFAKITSSPLSSNLNLETFTALEKARYLELKSLVQEINKSDHIFMEKISNRMVEIKEDLKRRSIFRNKAIPGYLKQMHAFA